MVARLAGWESLTETGEGLRNVFALHVRKVFQLAFQFFNFLLITAQAAAIRDLARPQRAQIGL